MSATFACPHCGASYPFKPVLVGRAVRCTTCKNPFKLREDGVADKVVEAPAPSAAPAPQPPTRVPPPAPPAPARVAPSAPPAPPAPRPSALAPKNGVSALNPPPAPTERPTTAVQRTARAERLNQQQEDARKAMAASLSTAASAALSADAVKREAETEKKTERRKKAAAKSGAPAEGRVGDIGPVVLMGTGEREHRNRMVWLLGAVAAIAVLGGLFWLIARDSPREQALIHYASVAPPERTRYPDRLHAIQERAWVLGVPALTELGRLSIHSARKVPFAPAREPLARLAGQTYVPGHQLWVAAPRAAEVDKWWDARKDRAANLANLQQRKIPVIDQRALAGELETAGWTADDVELLMILLQGSTARSGGNWIAQKLLAGELPEAMEVATFAGTKGEHLVDIGRGFKTRTVDYRGRLLRFVGGGWPGEWKVAEITTSTN